MKYHQSVCVIVIVVVVVELLLLLMSSMLWYFLLLLILLVSLEQLRLFLQEDLLVPLERGVKGLFHGLLVVEMHGVVLLHVFLQVLALELLCFHCPAQRAQRREWAQRQDAAAHSTMPHFQPGGT